MIRHRRFASPRVPAGPEARSERLLFDYAPDALVLLDRRGAVIDCNRQACLSLGWSREDLLRRSLAELQADVDLGQDLARFRALRPDQPVTLERTWIRKDGTRLAVDVRVGLLRPDPDPAYLAAVRDVASRKRLETELHQAQKMEALGRLAGGVSHDFNNMLTAILGYSEMALAGLPQDSPLREALEEIRRAGERAAGLTRQLLAFSRRQAIRPRAVDLSASISALSGILRRLIPESIRVELDLAKDLGCVRADPGHIDQIVLNLALNARDAMPDGGVLRIGTSAVDLSEDFARAHPGSAPGRYVLLAVADTGTGIPKEAIPHLFEPFYTTKGIGRGTGLGLATVYGIVRQMGGFLSLTTQPGQGTTFRAYLPRLDPTERPAGESQVVEAIGGTESILLVEDDAVVRLFVSQCLRQGGYQVVEAADPAEAIGRLEAPGAAFHLLLTDMVMPGMSGRELVRRARERRPALPVVYMTGYTEDDALREGRLEPGCALISKPFTAVELLTRIRKSLSANAPPPAR